MTGATWADWGEPALAEWAQSQHLSYTALAALTAGMQTQVTLPPVQTVGLIIEMVKAILSFADQHIAEASNRGHWQRADVFVRDAVAMAIGFFSMRQSDELAMNKAHTHVLSAHPSAT